MSRVDEIRAAISSSAKLGSIIRVMVLQIAEQVKAGDLDKADMCDIGFFARELIEQIEDTRKDIKAMKALVDKIACIKVMQETLQDPSKEQSMKGEFSSGRPHYKKIVTLPKKDSPEYQKMLDYFGVSEIGQKLGVASISWKRVCDFVSERAESGKTIPDFLPKVFDEFTVIHRRKQ